MLFEECSISCQLIDFSVSELVDINFSLVLPINLMSGFQKTGCGSFPKPNPLKQPESLYLHVTSHILNVLVSAPKCFPWKWAGQKWNFTTVAVTEIDIWGLDQEGLRTFIR